MNGKNKRSFRPGPTDLNSVEAVEHFRKAAAEFMKALAAADIAPDVTAEITEKLDKYQSGFMAWVETAQKTADYDASMTNTFKKVEPVIAEIGQGVDQLYTEADAAETTTRDTVRTWMLIALALEILLMSCVSGVLRPIMSLS